MVLAIGLTYLILLGGIDLSVGSVLALCIIVAGKVITMESLSVPIAIILAIAASIITGVLCGLFNGYVSNRWNLHPFIVTLGMLNIARGAAQQISNSRTIFSFPAVFNNFGSQTFTGVPVIFLISLIMIITGFMLRKTVFGRVIYAVGNNEESARLSGHNSGFYKVIVFVISGYCVGIAAILYMLWLKMASPILGVGFGSMPSLQQSFTTKDDMPHIALVMKSLANEFFLTMEHEARAHQKSSDTDYILTANGIRNEIDVSGQVRIIENMTAQDVDALIVAPADSRALIPVCAKAIELGIVVINIDNRFDQETLSSKSLRIPFVGPDNRKGAKMVGTYLAEHLEPGDGVAILEGIPTAYNSQERKAGFIEAFREQNMNILTVRSAEWDMEKANIVVAALINEYPDVKGIACANDSMVLGTVATLKAAGKLDSVHVVCFDNISAVQEMFKNGQILATADQFGGQIAINGIEYALEILRTGS